MSPNAKDLEVPSIRNGERRCTACLVVTQSWRSKLLHWATYFLALSFYFLTVLYAWHPEFVSRLEAIGSSPAKALQLLAILSGIANPMLSAAIGQAIDTLRAILISRSQGHNFMDNLSLQQGIGFDGLWDIIRLRGLPRYKPKAWAAFRVVSMVVVPVLAILILTNVEAAVTLYPTTTVPASRGYGIGTFNASLAILLNPTADLTFSTRFKDFLSDPDRSRDVTTAADRDYCAININNTCRTSYFVPGGVENFAPALLAGKNFTNGGAIQPVLALDQRGYRFEFEDDQSTVDYDPDVDCITSGFVIGAFQLCLKNRAPNELLAYITSCPKELAANAACLLDTSWHLQKGWRTNLAIFSQFATVAYNGLNGTILSHTYTNDSLTPVNINATELLGVYDTILGSVDLNSSYGKKLTLLGLSTNKPVLPLTVWEYFQGLQTRAEDDSRTNRQAAVGLQSFLTLALYHCQGKDFNELRKLLIGTDEANVSNITRTVGQDIVSMFPSVEPDTNIVPAILRYNLKVDRSVLLAYIVLAGTTLALCLIAQITSSFTKMGRRIREISAFPPLHHLCECQIQYYNDESRVPLRDFGRLNELGAYEQLLAVSKMRVVLAPKRRVGIDEKTSLMDEEKDADETGLSSKPVSICVAPSMLGSHLY